MIQPHFCAWCGEELPPPTGRQGRPRKTCSRSRCRRLNGQYQQQERAPSRPQAHEPAAPVPGEPNVLDYLGAKKAVEDLADASAALHELLTGLLVEVEAETAGARRMALLANALTRIEPAIANLATDARKQADWFT